jgi:hypothetical protein
MPAICSFQSLEGQAHSFLSQRRVGYLAHSVWHMPAISITAGVTAVAASAF